MSKNGYIYVLVRADFIEQKKYIYKIGETQRFPPHKRLWEYPYGSVFLSLVQTKQPLQFEKTLKEKLSCSSKVQCAKEIGIEYYEGDLSNILNIISELYKIYNQSTLTLTPLNEDILLTLNRIHYIVNYDADYFSTLYQHGAYLSYDPIPSEKIYESYKQFRGWHVAGFPDNYVIRCGLTPIKPNKKIYYHVDVTND
jgi:hypothetical protein